MILESIVTSTNSDGTTNVAPMGPTIHETMATFELRPFDTSRTFANLKRTRCGVLHVTDDSEMFARAAIGTIKAPSITPAEDVVGCILKSACRAYEFKVEYIDETGPRMNLNCRTVKVHRMRDFFGFNRAKHAVIEAAILSTRVDFLPMSEITDSFSRFQTIVDKTGGLSEHRAFKLLSEFIEQHKRADLNPAAENSTGA
jgi:hypothetical protein